MASDRDQLHLIERARQGDRAAFDQLALSHDSSLRALIHILLGEGLRGRVEVDDLLQETLLRAFRSLGSFQGGTHDALRNWLASVAHHAVLDGARRLSASKQDYRREVPLPAELTSDSSRVRSPAPELSAPDASPSRVLRRKERLERLLGALDSLEPDHRRVVLLTRIEGLAVKDVAQRMGRSEKAVSMLLLRALLALRAVFAETDSLGLPSDAGEWFSRPVEGGREGQVP